MCFFELESEICKLDEAVPSFSSVTPHVSLFFPAPIFTKMGVLAFYKMPL